jgi:hypothetical protein
MTHIANRVAKANAIRKLVREMQEICHTPRDQSLAILEIVSAFPELGKCRDGAIFSNYAVLEKYAKILEHSCTIDDLDD